MRITDAAREDASLIADAIMAAVGEEICRNMAGENHSLDDVKAIFTRLAESPESQYSWLNTRIAVADDGAKAGVCISYDGDSLIRLRRSFFEEAKRNLGWEISSEEIDGLPCETTPDEFYLDTLMILPEYRKRGFASALIADAADRAAKSGKPLGLLVDDHNTNARRLYDSLGFVEKGLRPFAGVEMHHLQLG